MQILADKEAIEKLNHILDIYVKTIGINGINTVLEFSRSTKPIEEKEATDGA